MRYLNCKIELSEGFVDYFIANRQLWARLVDFPIFKSEGICEIAQVLFQALGVGDIQKLYVFDFDLLNQLEREGALVDYFTHNCGSPLLDVELEFHELLPGYVASVQCWVIEGFYLILVKDFTGFYLYAIGKDHMVAPLTLAS